MPTVGEQLRSAREQQKLSFGDVAEMTKIRTDHLRALEAGQYATFSAAVYIRGFVRSYAGVVKLDVPRILQELDAELAQTKEHRQMPNLVERWNPLDPLLLLLSKIHWRWTAVVVGGVVIVGLLALGIRAWHRAATADPLAKLGPGLYQPDSTNQGLTLSLPASNP